MPDTSVCRYWDCSVTIPLGQEFCYPHHTDSERGFIDSCRYCGRAKRVQHVACLDCYDTLPRNQQSASIAGGSPASGPPAPPRGALVQEIDTEPGIPSVQKQEPEPAQPLRRQVRLDEQHFLYILTMDGGKFYAGHTSELREQMSRHRDGQDPGTVGKHPKLVWFATVPTAEEAAQFEADLRQLVETDPQQVLRMVVDFHNLVGQLDTGD